MIIRPKLSWYSFLHLILPGSIVSAAGLLVVLIGCFEPRDKFGTIAIGLAVTAFGVAPMSLLAAGSHKIILQPNGFFYKRYWRTRFHEWRNVERVAAIGDAFSQGGAEVLVVLKTKYLFGRINKQLRIPDLFSVRRHELAKLMERYILSC